MDLRPRLADNCCRSIYRRTSATELKTPRGIASQSAKSLLFNKIDRWVFRCAVVEALDVGKDITPGFLTYCILLVMDEFGFDGVEKALHRSIVIAISPAAHRGPEA